MLNKCSGTEHKWEKDGEEGYIPRKWLWFSRYFFMWHHGQRMSRVRLVQPVKCSVCGAESQRDAVGHVFQALCVECGEHDTGPILT